MSSFRYQARGPGGRLERGVIDAPTTELAIDRLRRRNLTPLELASSGDTHAFGAPPLDDKTAHEVSRTLAHMLQAGLSFTQALNFASEELGTRASSITSRMRDAVERGEPASSAFDGVPGVQARLLKGVVAAGETSGRLSEALEVAAASFARTAALRARLGTALVYPSFVITATLATLACFLLLVVPSLGQAFLGHEADLPTSTRTLLHFSAWLRGPGAPILGGCVLLIAAAALSPNLRAPLAPLIDHALDSPLGLGVAPRLDYGAFSGLAALSLRAGVPALNAFEAAAHAVRNARIRNRLLAAIEEIRLGERPSLAFAQKSRAPKSFVRLTRVGEETGRLGESLQQASILLSNEAEHLLERLGAIAGPIITLLLGLVVAGVVMSLFLGLLSMSELATL